MSMTHRGYTRHTRWHCAKARGSAAMPSACAGYTLIELIIAVGLFAVVMTLASGAYFVMIDINRQTQNITAGINDLSFALESMTRSIRTGASYACDGPPPSDCFGGSSFSFTDSLGDYVVYSRNSSTFAIQKTVNGGMPISITDSSAIKINTLTFYVSGTEKPPADYEQPHVSIVISGEITPDPKKPLEVERFTVETGATMRGADL